MAKEMIITGGFIIETTGGFKRSYDYAQGGFFGDSAMCERRDTSSVNMGGSMVATNKKN